MHIFYFYFFKYNNKKVFLGLSESVDAKFKTSGDLYNYFLIPKQSYSLSLMTALITHTCCKMWNLSLKVSVKYQDSQRVFRSVLHEKNATSPFAEN